MCRRRGEAHRVLSCLSCRWLWSRFDIGDVHVQGVGVIDSRLHTVGVWLRPDERTDEEAASMLTAAMSGGAGENASGASYGENLHFTEYDHGIVYFLRPSDNQVLGVLFWNLEERLDEKLHAARRLLAQKRKFKNDTTLVTQIPA